MDGGVEVDLATGAITEMVRFWKSGQLEPWLGAAPPGHARTPRAGTTVVRLMRLRSEGRALYPVHPEELAKLRQRAGWLA